MEVTITPSQQRKGWFPFRRTVYHVTTAVEFDEIELAIIKERDLKTFVVMEDPDEQRPLFSLQSLMTGGFIWSVVWKASKIFITGVTRGWSYNHKGMSVEKLMRRPFKQEFRHILEQKEYMENIKKRLRDLKDIMAASANDAKSEVMSI